MDAAIESPAQHPATHPSAPQQVRLLHEMLHLDTWCYFPLKIQLLSSEHAGLRAGCPPLPGHVDWSIGPAETLPVGSMTLEEETLEEDDDGLERSLRAWPAVSDASGDEAESAGASVVGAAGAFLDAGVPRALAKSGARAPVPTCAACGEPAVRTWCLCPHCSARFHVGCLGRSLVAQGDQGLKTLPTTGRCPRCDGELVWASVLNSIQNAGWQQSPRKKRQAARKKGSETAESPSPAKAPGRAKGASPAAPKRGAASQSLSLKSAAGADAGTSLKTTPTSRRTKALAPANSANLEPAPKQSARRRLSTGEEGDLPSPRAEKSPARQRLPKPTTDADTTTAEADSTSHASLQAVPTPHHSRASALRRPLSTDHLPESLPALSTTPISLVTPSPLAGRFRTPRREAARALTPPASGAGDAGLQDADAHSQPTPGNVDDDLCEILAENTPAAQHRPAAAVQVITLT